MNGTVGVQSGCVRTTWRCEEDIEDKPQQSLLHKCNHSANFDGGGHGLENLINPRDAKFSSLLVSSVVETAHPLRSSSEMLYTRVPCVPWICISLQADGYASVLIE